ncbi:hypothetical protein ACA910_012782 [Epithemia clementina (nom. ined.)]
MTVNYANKSLNYLARRVLVVLLFIQLNTQFPNASAFVAKPPLLATRGTFITLIQQQQQQPPPTSASLSTDATFWSRARGDGGGGGGMYLLYPKTIRIQRKSVGTVQTCLFGLGFGEIAVILLVMGAVLGPENIGRIVKSSSSRAKDLSEGLKRVPDEFQKGLEEGESDAKARNAKRIKIIRPGEGDDDEENEKNEKNKR